MTKKPKVLLVSYLFAPNNVIGAFRPSKIAERLVKDGYDVDVFTYGYTDNDSLEIEDAGINKYLVDSVKKEQRKVSKVSSLNKKKDNILVYKIKRHYVTYLSSRKDKRFLDEFKRVYDSVLFKNDYDAVFTTFGPLCNLQAGLYVKKKNPEIKWICDFRDPIVVDFAPELYRPYFKYMQEIACKKADYIVTVSNGYLNRICKGRYEDKSFMIPNGYDLKDKPKSEIILDNSILKLTYVGALYLGKRDLSPIFKAIKELNDENKVDANKIVFEYAGTEFVTLKNQAEQYSVDSILNDNGVLSRKDCLKLQFSSHALILSTWNTKGEEGVFPGKFLEYMLIGKPIISVVDGDLPDSEVTAVVKEGKLGISYESSNSKKDFQTLKDYIHKLYIETVENNGFEFNPNSTVLERYNYDNIMKKIEKLI